MKKGLLLALTLMALVVLVLPASALAPTINLNGIVIGDNGSTEVDTASGKHLFRYNDAAQFVNPTTNADGIVVRKNGFPASQLHVFYMTNQASPRVIKASTKTFIATEVVATDLTKLADGTGIAGIPSIATKDIVSDSDNNGSDDFYWLSLINDGAGKLTKTNSYDATAAGDGMLAAEYAPYVGHDKPVSLTLFAAETDNPTTYGQKTVQVWTVAGMDDGTTGSAWSPVKEWTFTAGAEGWVWSTFNVAAYPYIGQSTQVAPAGGTLIHSAGAPTTGNIKYGSWNSPNSPGSTAVIDVEQLTNEGKLLRADCLLKATATSYQNCPGWRILYNNIMFNHTGGASMAAAATTKQYKTAPQSGTDLHVQLLWAPQFTLTGMADNGTLDGGITVSGSSTPSPVDWRDYYMEFDILDTDNTDTGNLLLDSITVTLGDEPAAGAVKIAEWGTAAGAVAFNALPGVGGFYTAGTSTGGLAGGYTAGTANATAGAVTMNLAGNAGYKQVVTYPTATAGVPAWHSDKIVKSTITISTSDQRRTPWFRYLTATQTSTGVFLPLLWVDGFDSGNNNYKYQPAMVSVIPPATPGTSATTIEYWLFTHTANPATGVVLTQQMDIFNGTSSPTGWSSENATLTISGLKMEEFAKTW